MVTPHSVNWQRHCAAFAIYCFNRALLSTLRPRWVDKAGLAELARDGPLLFAIWHNRLALSMLIFHGYVKKAVPGSKLAALVSASRDGALLSKVLEYFQVQAVRGSTSRRGPQALLELTSAIEKGWHVAITPDGPRGPVYKVQDGILALAQLTQRPIVPTLVRINWKVRAGGWDRFQIPIPFSRAEVCFQEAFFVPRGASPEERNQIKKQMEERMGSNGE